MPETDNVTRLRPRHPCPICRRPSARETYPFCSERCKSVDLGRWFSGSYVIPGETEDEPAESPGDSEA